MRKLRRFRCLLYLAICGIGQRRLGLRIGWSKCRRFYDYARMIKVRLRRFQIIGKWLIAAGILTAVSYPIIISPMLDPEPYKEWQNEARKGIIQENVQPGNMRIWRDPFGRK